MFISGVFVLVLAQSLVGSTTIMMSQTNPPSLFDVLQGLILFILHVPCFVSLYEKIGGPALCGTSQLMLTLINRLINPHIINLKTSRNIITKSQRQPTRTLRIPTLITITLTPIRTRLGKPPTTRHSRIQQHITRLTGNLRSRQLQRLRANTVHEFVVAKPTQVASVSGFVGGVPFEPVLVLLFEVGFVYSHVRGEGVRLVCVGFWFVEEGDAVEERVYSGFCHVSVFEPVVPVFLSR
mmetsp:Transcript_24987/g.30163  ORF Transcript_24987/g.30163 Transcript_24987/m.30163 type:complete len:238 (-) Transcript_24987:124-837(-)